MAGDKRCRTLPSTFFSKIKITNYFQLVCSQELKSLRRSIEQVPLKRQGNALSADMDEDSGMTMKDVGKSRENPEREVTATGRTRQLRKSGRPRLDSPGAAVLSSVCK
jgi:hypothetical protein